MKNALLASLVCVVLTAASIGFIRARPRGAGSTGAPDRPHTLREKATRAGRITAGADPRNLRQYDDVQSLARSSALVVVGSVDSQASSLLPPQEEMIVTDYQVSVAKVLKGRFQAGQTISVRAPGGQVKLENGSSAQVQLPDYWKNPVVGRTYILFLETRPDGHFVISGGPQGLFEIKPDGAIESQARPEDKVRQTSQGKSQEALTAEIQRAAVSK